MSSTMPSNYLIETTTISDYGDTRRVSSTRSIRALTGRKTFKTASKGRTGRMKEAIWPESLEAALIQALREYEPYPSRGGRSNLQRFPKRNSIIAKRLYDLTGQRRTNKQVGSRLQQLRDTSKNPEILRLLTDKRRFDSGSEGSRTCSSPSLSSSSRAPSAEAQLPPVSIEFSLPSPTVSVVSLPSETPVAPISLLRTFDLDLFFAEDDWSHCSQSPPEVVVDMATPHIYDADHRIAIPTPQSHSYVAPYFHTKHLDLTPASIDSCTFTVYCNHDPVRTDHCDVATDGEGGIISQMTLDSWMHIIGNIALDCVFTIVQTIRSSGPVHQTIVDLTYNIHGLFDSTPSPLVSGLSTPISYHEPHTIINYTDLMSPIEHYDYAPLASPTSSVTICSPTPTYAQCSPSPPLSDYSYGIYPADSWSYPIPTYPHRPQLHFPYDASGHYSDI